MRTLVQSFLQQLPTPSSSQALSDIRDAVVTEQLERIQVERAAIATRYRMDRAAGHAALLTMVERLLSAHHAQVSERVPATGPARWWHALDEQLQQPVSAPSADPHIGAPRRIRALRGAARLDRLSGAVDRVCALLSALDVDGPLRVLDLNTGHGDLAVGLAAWARANNIDLHLTIADDREGMRDYAAARVAAAGLQPHTAVVDLHDPTFEAFDLICGWGLAARLGSRAALVHWEATQVARAVLLVEGWRSPERTLLSSALAARPSGGQEALHAAAAAVTPQELRLLTAGALGRVHVEEIAPSAVAALWQRRY